jgi:molybdate transport system permease protein
VFGFSPDEWTAIELSLRVATVGTLFGLPVALLAAYGLARWHFPGKIIVDGILHLPLVLPPVVTGYMLLLTFGRQGFLGKELYELFGITFSFRWTGAALASGVMGFPLMLRAIRLSFEAIDRRLETAAGTLALPGVLVGAILCFAKALGEFGATITFVSNIPGETQTIPSAIYTYTQVPGGEGQALRLTFVSIAIAMAALVVSEVLNRRIQKRIAVFE